MLRLLDKLMRGPVLIQLLVVLALTALLTWAFVSVTGQEIYQVFQNSTNPPDNPELKYADKNWIMVEFIVFSVIFLGLFVTLFVNWIDRRRERYIAGDARYNIRWNFDLILGGHEMVPSLCKNLLARSRWRRIVILSERNSEELRKEIFSQIPESARSRVNVYNGNCVSESDLVDVHPQCAKSIYILGEPEYITGSDHDELNMTSFDMISKQIGNSGRNRVIPVHVMFCYHSTFMSFQFTDLVTPLNVRFIPFSFYETWAQQVLMAPEDKDYLPLEGEHRLKGNSEQRVHLIIVGMSRMGVAMAVQAAQLAHYPNFHHTGRRTLITVIDSDMETEMNYFKSRFPVMFDIARQRYVSGKDVTYTPDFAPEAGWVDPIDIPEIPYTRDSLGDEIVDIDWEFINGNVASPEIRSYLVAASADQRSITTIAVCIPDTVQSLTAAMYMPDSVYHNVNQILVYQPTSKSIVTALREGGVRTAAQVITASRGRSKMRPFGMKDCCDYLSPVYNLAGKLINYFYNSQVSSESRKDFDERKFSIELYNEVERLWAQIGIDGGNKGKSALSLKWSSIYNANTIPIKLRALGLTYHVPNILPDDVKELARTEHIRWNVEQILAGFRPELPSDNYPDLTAKRNNMIHPSITSFDNLKEDEQLKDDALTKCIPSIIAITEQATEYFKNH